MTQISVSKTFQPCILATYLPENEKAFSNVHFSDQQLSSEAGKEDGDSNDIWSI